MQSLTTTALIAHDEQPSLLLYNLLANPVVHCSFPAEMGPCSLISFLALLAMHLLKQRFLHHMGLPNPMLQGLTTIALGFYIKISLADSPAKAQFLTPAERSWLQHRVALHKVKAC